MGFALAVETKDAFGIIGIIAVIVIFILMRVRDKTKKKEHFQDFYKKSFFAYGMYAFVLFLMVSPFVPYQNDWFWNNFEGSIGGDIGTGHLDYEGNYALDNIDVVFKFVDGLDLDGNKPSTDTASITGGIYTVDPTKALWYEDLWLANKIGFDDFSELVGLSLIETFTASSGVVTTTSNQFDSKQIVWVEAGTACADEEAAVPLKSQWYKAIVQGASSESSDTVNLGMYTFEFYPHPDDNADISFTLKTGDNAAVTANNLDWSDASGTVKTMAQITMVDEHVVLRSYYDRANDRWYDWYIVGSVSERNCTTSEALSVSTGGVSSGELAISDTLNFYIKLSTGHIYSDSKLPAGMIGYLFDEAGNEHPDYDNIWLIDITFNLGGCTSAGGTDNYQELLITLDGGTWYRTDNLLNAGAISDDTTANNFKNDFDATYFIAT